MAIEIRQKAELQQRNSSSSEPETIIWNQKFSGAHLIPVCDVAFAKLT